MDDHSLVKLENIELEPPEFGPEVTPEEKNTRTLSNEFWTFGPFLMNTFDIGIILGNGKSGHKRSLRGH